MLSRFVNVPFCQPTFFTRGKISNGDIPKLLERVVARLSGGQISSIIEYSRLLVPASLNKTGYFRQLLP
jgi:hypothetical protein